MFEFIALTVTFAAGYAASVWTWPWLRAKFPALTNPVGH